MSEEAVVQECTEPKKSTKDIIFKVLLFTILFSLITGIIISFSCVTFIEAVIRDTKPINVSNMLGLLEQSSYILDSDGAILERIESDCIRDIVSLNKIPDYVQKAFVAIEDERFYRHNGIDIQRIVGAAWTNYRTGSRQGASTITQQLAKLLFLSKEQTITRKIRDAYYALIMEEQLSKEEILETYLNTIYLGNSTFGVQAASQVFFSKDVGQLTIAESAALAGITRNPSMYAPFINIEKEELKTDMYVIDDSDSQYAVVFNPKSVERQHLVLKMMLQNKYISESEYKIAINSDIKTSLRPGRFSRPELSSYFGDLVKKDVVEELLKEGYTKEQAMNMLSYGGLRIFSTLDTKMQKILEDEYNNPKNFPRSRNDGKGNLQPQSAMVIIDYRKGEIKSMIGGRMITGKKIYNRALAPRQPGSAIKPLAVYTPALALGYTSASIIKDEPVFFDSENPKKPWPRNWYGKGYLGPITMREAIRMSSNVAAVVMAKSLGYDDKSCFDVMFEYMERMGITSIVKGDNPIVTDGEKHSDETLAIALGGMTKGVSPLEMAGAYSSLANGGQYIKPRTFTVITDSTGRLIMYSKLKIGQVLSPQAAYIMTDMLQGAVSGGTGSKARLDRGNSKIPVAGKTGTTTNKKDAWFVGYTPYYTASVWIGYDMPAKLSDGSGMAAALWKKVMSRVHEDLPPKKFERPDGLVQVKICTIDGMLATEQSEMVRSEFFIKGQQPKKKSTYVKPEPEKETINTNTEGENGLQN